MKKSRQDISMEKDPYFQDKYPSLFGEENPHLTNWRFPHGQPPNSNEAFFAGRDAGAVWAAGFAGNYLDVEAFVGLYHAGKIRMDDYNSVYTSPAHQYLHTEVTYGQKGWVCMSADLAEAFSQGFVEAVLHIQRLRRSSLGNPQVSDHHHFSGFLN